MTAPFNNNVDAILQLPVGVAIVAADTRLLSWNVQAESISGYTFEQISALGIDRLLHPSDAISSMLHDAHRGVPTLHRRLELHRADGERISISVQCALQSSRDEGAYQAVITFRELMTLQACLRPDDHLLTLGILATSFSHEIRHPLNALFLYIDEMEAAWFEQVPAIRNHMQACVADIKRETTRLDELAQNYLSLAGLDNMQYEPIELATVVEAFVQKLQPLLSAGGMSLRIVLHDRLGEVSLNFNTFLRALLNLARNAIDAMSVGGGADPAWMVRRHGCSP